MPIKFYTGTSGTTELKSYSKIFGERIEFSLFSATSAVQKSAQFRIAAGRNGYKNYHIAVPLTITRYNSAIKDVLPDILRLRYGTKSSFNAYAERKKDGTSSFSATQTYICEKADLFVEGETILAGRELAKVARISGDEIKLNMATDAIFSSDDGFLTKIIKIGDLTPSTPPAVITLELNITPQAMTDLKNLLAFGISGYCEGAS